MLISVSRINSIRFALLFVTVGLLLFGASTVAKAAGPMAYYEDGWGGFGIMDLYTGAQTQISTMMGKFDGGGGWVNGLGVANGTLYITNNNANVAGQLYSINTTTGAVHYIGSSGASYVALGSTSNGLFAFGYDNFSGTLSGGNFYSINPATGAATRLGKFYGLDGQQFLFPMLSTSNDTSSLYGMGNGGGGNLGHSFDVIDPATGVANGYPADPVFYSMMAESGTVYAILGNAKGYGTVYTINPANGTETTYGSYVCSTGPEIVGLAPVPLPAIALVNAVSPGSSSFGASGGTGTVTVTSNSSWTASSNDSWIAITSGSGLTGNGSVSYTVSYNGTGSARTGSLTIGNMNFPVYQPQNDFSDNLDTSTYYFQPINALYATGITTGCGNNNFCTTDFVTREQMAAFIIRSLQGENFSYTQQPYFTDVPSGAWSFKYVQKLKDLGLTTNVGIYNASGYVTREQMAAFIIRAKFGEEFIYTSTPYFNDVPSNAWSFKYVQKMKDLGYTTTSGTYGAADNVTREQMAAFLARAFLEMMPTSTASQNLAALLVGVWTMDASQTSWPNESTTGWTSTVSLLSDNTFTLLMYNNGALDENSFGTWQISGNSFSATTTTSNIPSKIGKISTGTITLYNNNNTLTISNFKPGEIDVYNR